MHCRRYILRTELGTTLEKEMLDLICNVLRVVEEAQRGYRTNQELDDLKLMISESNTEKEARLPLGWSTKPTVHQGDHVTDIINNHGPFNVVSNLTFERGGGIVIKPVLGNPCFKNPEKRLLRKFVEKRASELARLKSGIAALVPSARCATGEDVITGVAVPPPVAFYVGHTVVVPVPPSGSNASTKHQQMMSHFHDPFWSTELQRMGVAKKNHLINNTKPLMEMAKSCVQNMAPDAGAAGARKWDFQSLKNRHDASRSDFPLHQWTPTSGIPLSPEDEIMKSGWNMGSVDFFQEAEVEGIKVRTHRRDCRAGAKSMGAGFCVEVDADNGGPRTRAWGLIQHLFRWRPFNHAKCPTYNFASAVWIEKERSVVNNDKDCTCVVIDLFSTINMKERVVQLETMIHGNVFFIKTNTAESKAKPSRRPVADHHADLHYDMIAAPRNERPPMEYY